MPCIKFQFDDLAGFRICQFDWNTIFTYFSCMYTDWMGTYFWIETKSHQRFYVALEITTRINVLHLYVKCPNDRCLHFCALLIIFIMYDFKNSPLAALVVYIFSFVSRSIHVCTMFIYSTTLNTWRYGYMVMFRLYHILFIIVRITETTITFYTGFAGIVSVVLDFTCFGFRLAKAHVSLNITLKSSLQLCTVTSMKSILLKCAIFKTIQNSS